MLRHSNMLFDSPRRGDKNRSRHKTNRNFNSPQFRPSSHLSAWPDVKAPKSPSSAPKPALHTKKFGGDEPRSVLAKDSQSLQAKKSESEPSPRKKISLSDGEEDSTSNSSSGSSLHGSANDNKLAQARTGSNLPRHQEDLSSGDDCNLTDDQKKCGKADSSQFTPEEGTSKRKEVLKDATASQKRDKRTGKKKNKDKGGSENVFNARSPDKEISNALDDNDNTASTRVQERLERRSSPASHFLDTLTADFLSSHNQSSNAPSSPARLCTILDEHSTLKSVPVRSRPVDTSQRQQTNSLSTAASRTNSAELAALTEAQHQANLLRRGGHREFSSKAFEPSDDEYSSKEAAQGSELGNKTKRKKEKSGKDKINPVEAEIAKQQVRYKEIMAQRRKDHPEHYSKKGADKIHELTSEDESGTDRDSQAVETHGRSRDAAAPSPPSRDQINDQSVTKKDKKQRKRKREHEDDGAEVEERIEKKRKRSKRDSKKEQRIAEFEGLFEEMLDHLQKLSGKATATGKVSKRVSAATGKLYDMLAPIGHTKVEDPYTALDYHKAKHDAEFSKTLKSLWSILPKSILHTTMANLNRANRRSLQERLQHCLKGKQTNENIRVVKRIDDVGDEVDMLEEYGVISEPDPHTMNSDLTLLTAAKNLIVLLSGQRVGLDLATVVNKALSGEVVGNPFLHKLGTKDQPFSPMEEELRRIARDRQKEVEKLKEENRVLTAELKNSKR